MEKLGFPFLLCHNLNIKDDEIISYKLRHPQAKKQAILSFQEMGYRCFAAGDSHNDIQMFDVAEKGFFLNAPDKISSKYPEIESFKDYDQLRDAIVNNSMFVK
jgi:phosphoserine/homoserine phosphotransferase